MLVGNSAAGRAAGYRCAAMGGAAPLALVSPCCDDSTLPCGCHPRTRFPLYLLTCSRRSNFVGNHRTGAPRNFAECTNRLFPTFRHVSHLMRPIGPPQVTEVIRCPNAS